MARLRRVFLNVGAGPLKHRLSMFFVKRALRFADYISFRDEKSQTLIQQIGFSGKSKVVTDNVYCLEIPRYAISGLGRAGNSFPGAAARDPWFHARPAPSSFSSDWLSLQVTSGVALGNKSSNWLASSPLYQASAAARRPLMLSPFATNSLNVFKSESASKLSISTQYCESPISFISVATFE